MDNGRNHSSNLSSAEVNQAGALPRPKRQCRNRISVRRTGGLIAIKTEENEAQPNIQPLRLRMLLARRRFIF